MNIIKRLDWTRMAGLAILVLGGVIVQLGGCNREQPVERTEAYYALHGLVPGQVNELQIGEYKFRFPAENFPEPYTYAKRASDIVKGRAERATVYLDVSRWVGLPLATHRARGDNAISVEYRPAQTSQSEKEKRLADYIQSQPWTSNVDLPELGLKRLHDARGGWGYLTYMPISADIQNLSIGKPIFFCTGYQSLQPTECSSSLIYSKKIHITYYFSGRLLPHWKEVHHEVLNFVDTTLIKN